MKYEVGDILVDKHGPISSIGYITHITEKGITTIHWVMSSRIVTYSGPNGLNGVKKNYNVIKVKKHD